MSIPPVWHAYGTFGARKLTNWTPLLIMTASLAVAATRGYLLGKVERVQAALLLTLIGLFAFTYIGVARGQKEGSISVMHPESLAGFYRQGVRNSLSALDELGPLPVLPATLVYSLRFRMSPGHLPPRDSSSPRAARRFLKC